MIKYKIDSVIDFKKINIEDFSENSLWKFHNWDFFKIEEATRAARNYLELDSKNLITDNFINISTLDIHEFIKYLDNNFKLKEAISFISSNNEDLFKQVNKILNLYVNNPPIIEQINDDPYEIVDGRHRMIILEKVSFDANIPLHLPIKKIINCEEYSEGKNIIEDIDTVSLRYKDYLKLKNAYSITTPYYHDGFMIDKEWISIPQNIVFLSNINEIIKFSNELKIKVLVSSTAIRCNKKDTIKKNIN